MPVAVTQLLPHSVLTEGTVECTTLNQAETFSLILTDHGRNPPNQDAYRLTVYDSSGAVIYDWEDLTTVDLGDLLIRTR